MIIEPPKVYLIADNERIKDKINSITDKLGYAVKSFTSGIEYFNNYDKTKNSCTIVNMDLINPFNVSFYVGINDIHCDGNCLGRYRFQAIQSSANDCPKYLPQLACVTDALKEKIRSVTSPFIFVSEYANTEVTSNAFKLGAYDFIDYNSIDAVLPSRLQEGMILDISKKRHLIETANATELLNLLSTKEREVLGLLVRGFCHKKIAKLLNISYRTVETHSSHIKLKTKLGISELVFIVSPLIPR